MTVGTLRNAAPMPRVVLALLAFAALLVLFKDTAWTMASTWFTSSTYTHAVLVAPMVGWMVWRLRDELARQPTRPMPWLLVPMAGVCLLWLLGDLAQVNALTQLALVTLIVLSVPALFGMAVTRVILFPLAFLYFAVPMGDFMLPTMMEWTADFTVAALRLSGVPVYREANHFVIPSGSWSVVEACSGVRYLIASLMVGSLFAYLNYRSMMRRAVFIGISILVPIVANWLRAYMIVMLGHLSNNKIATGVDHIIYGWLFFGVVVMIMFAIGSMWAEPDAPATTSAVRAQPAVGGPVPWGVLVGIFVLTAATQALAWRFDHAQAAEPVVSLPDMDGRAPAPLTLVDIQPAFRDPDAIAAGQYTIGDRSVGVWVGYYRNQSYRRKLVTPDNAVVKNDDKTWAIAASGLADADGVTVRNLALSAAGMLAAHSARRVQVWQVYWIGGRYMISDARARLQLALNRLLGRGDDSAAVLMFVSGQPSDQADAVLQRFAPEFLRTLDQRLAATRDQR